MRMECASSGQTLDPSVRIFLPLQKLFLCNPFLQETAHRKGMKSTAQPESKRRV